MSGGSAQLSTDGPPNVWNQSGSRIGFTVRGHDYVAYAPTGASWTLSGTTITSTLAGKSYFTVAVLPTSTSSSNADRIALADSYGRYAHAHVTGTTIGLLLRRGQRERDAPPTRITTTRREGSEARTVVSLYPHQWKALTGASAIEQTYVSPRGTMKNLVGVSSFSTEMKFHGILPEIPAVATSAGADRATLDSSSTRWPMTRPVSRSPTPTGPARDWGERLGSPRSPTSWATPPSGTRPWPR